MFTAFRLATLTSESEALSQSVKDLERDRSDLRRVTSTTRKEADDTLALLTAERTKSVDLTAQVAKLNDLQSSLSTEQDERATAEKELATAKEEINRLQDEITALHDAAAARAKADEDEKAEESKEGEEKARHEERLEERLTTLQNQHALELSTAKSQIRQLESSVFEAEKSTSASLIRGAFGGSFLVVQRTESDASELNLVPLPSFQSKSSKPRSTPSKARSLKPRAPCRSLLQDQVPPPQPSPPPARPPSTRSNTFLLDRSMPTCPRPLVTLERCRSRCSRLGWKPALRTEKSPLGDCPPSPSKRKATRTTTRAVPTASQGRKTHS